MSEQAIQKSVINAKNTETEEKSFCGSGCTQEQSDTPIEQLQKQILACRLCRERFGFEPRPVVFGHGDAPIVQIGQAPGSKVHQSGIPFTDQSGRTLREEWYHVDEDTFYDPDIFYMTMVGHCYPGKAKSGDKKPPKICWEKWTSQELEDLEKMDSARLFLIIGREAAEHLFGKRRMDDLVFSDLSLHGKPCFVLPHPSPLNRRWLKEHPDFEQIQLPKIRMAIAKVLAEKKKQE